MLAEPQVVHKGGSEEQILVVSGIVQGALMLG
jgi:hypothetical protein